MTEQPAHLTACSYHSTQAVLVIRPQMHLVRQAPWRWMRTWRMGPPTHARCAACSASPGSPSSSYTETALPGAPTVSVFSPPNQHADSPGSELSLLWREGVIPVNSMCCNGHDCSTACLGIQARRCGCSSRRSGFLTPSRRSTCGATAPSPSTLPTWCASAIQKLAAQSFPKMFELSEQRHHGCRC